MADGSDRAEFVVERETGEPGLRYHGNFYVRRVTPSFCQVEAF
jgi:hypothetical protein